MEITLNITEDSKVELVKDSCEAVQGERNVTILKLNFPSTIKGYSIDNYTKQIEFAECKELGECVKFFDVVEGDTYKLCDICTQFEKIMIQFTLKNLVDEAEPIEWKSVPFVLEFCKSINAEKTKQAQVVLLSLAEIEKEWADDLSTTKDAWQEFIKAHTLRIIYKVGDVPTADAASVGDTIFYLGANSTSPYVLEYGHYYRCNFANDAYEWTDLTIDPNLADVANGIREINNNQSMQLWVGTKEEIKNEVIQPNTIYIPEDHDIKETFDEILTEMIGGNEELLLDEGGKHIPVLDRKLQIDNNGILKFGDTIIPQKKLLYSGNSQAATLSSIPQVNDKLEIIYHGAGGFSTLIISVKDSTNDTQYQSNLSGNIGSSSSFGFYRDKFTMSSNRQTITMNNIQMVTYENGSWVFDTQDISGSTQQQYFYISKVYKIID